MVKWFLSPRYCLAVILALVRFLARIPSIVASMRALRTEDIGPIISAIRAFLQDILTGLETTMTMEDFLAELHKLCLQDTTDTPLGTVDVTAAEERQSMIITCTGDNYGYEFR